MLTTRYTIAYNRTRKTYTITRWDDGKVVSVYRSYPQGKKYSENWTQADIIWFLRHSDDYYEVR